MRFTLTKHGLAHDPRGAQVCLNWQGRQLLGDVLACYHDAVTGSIKLQVRHFNGEPWPIDPLAVAVEVLERYRNPNLERESN